jgi:hypothetical protein
MDMRDSEKKVGRADNNLDGERSVADDHPIDKPRPDVPTLPDEARGSDRGGSATWGSEGSGGSVKDKRPDR